MTLLLVPHGPLGHWWQGSRHFHLLAHLPSDVHVHVADVRPSGLPAPKDVAAGCGTPLTLHTIRVPRTFYRRLGIKYPGPVSLFLPQLIQRKKLRALARELQPDACVLTSNHHICGFPPKSLAHRTVFDYLDLSPSFVERWYCKAATGIVGITPALVERATQYGKTAILVPNGVDLELFKPVAKDEAKVACGLDPNGPVVSLIGLTCSDDFYFIDALRLVQARQPNITVVLVGSEDRGRRIAERAYRVGLSRLVVVRPLPHHKVVPYFQASDVGLYPGNLDPYYVEASPLKIAEYLAAGAQVVTSPVNLFRGISGVWTRKPTSEDFAEGIRQALSHPQPIGDLSEFDWRTLRQRFLSFVLEAAAP